METSLNQIVKGAPPADTKIPPVAPLPSLANASSATVAQISRSRRTRASSGGDSPIMVATDPALSSLPSSPPQIYLNLLILEASLRSQYVHLLSRRRLNTFFLLLLASWNAFFVWALFVRPREDGTGLGGSVYWVVETGEKVAFMGGIVTILFVWATGQWERGIRWPRKWLSTTNRGLRGFNLRVVIMKRRWWRQTLGHFAFLLPFALWQEAGGSDWHLVEHESGTVVEEDLARGGDHIMLLLLPKNFSSEFRENWEAYRSEYWEKENERRSMLRRKVEQHRRTKAKTIGGWTWWTGVWRLAGVSTQGQRKGQDLEKHSHAKPHHALSEKDVLLKQSRRRSVMRDGSHSRQSSRSSTPHLALPEIDGGSMEVRPLNERMRRRSSVSSTSSIRRSVRNKRPDGALSPLTATEDEAYRDKRTRKTERERDKAGDSRPTTPDDSLNGFARRVPSPA